MAQNASNQDFTNSSDGFILGGGTTERKLTLTGGDVTLTGSGSAVISLPGSTDTLVGRATTDTLTNKDLSSSTNTFPAMSKAGQGTTITANGTYKISGLGFQPSTILFFYGDSQGFSGTHQFRIYNGYYDRAAGTQGTIGGSVQYGTGAGANAGGMPDTSNCMHPNTANSSGTAFTASVTATDSDSFTITVASYAAGVPWFYIAFR